MSVEDKFELANDDYCKFELVENKRSNRKDLHALILLDSLFEPSDRDIVAAASHDVVYLEVSIEDLEKLTDSQVLELTRCGVMYDCENDCLAMFV